MTGEVRSTSTGSGHVDARPVVCSVLLGAGTGAVGAIAYFADPIRPLAHTVGLWVSACVVVAFARPAVPAITRCIAVLATAVHTFYGGRVVVYRLKYPESSSLVFDGGRTVLWLVFAVVAGIGLGYLLHLASSRRWRGAVGLAGPAGLLVGDAVVRISQYPSEFVAVGILTLAGCSLVVGLAVLRLDEPRVQLRRAALLVVPVVVLAMVVVSVPDVLEQMMLVV